MCRSMSEGGQRCASHTREKLEAKAAAVEAAVQAFSDSAGDPTALRAAQDGWEQAAAEYASTDEGHAHLSAQAAAADDMDTQALLNTVIAKGEALRAANRETAALIKAVRLAKTEPVTPAAGGPVQASTGVDIRQPDESPLDHPTVPDLPAKERAAWEAGLAAFDEVSPLIKEIPMHSPAGSVRQKPEEVREALHAIEDTMADATLSDDETAELLRTIERYRGMRTGMPQFADHGARIRDGQTNYEFQQAADARREAQRRQWSKFIDSFQKVLAAQSERTLSHPGAGHKTFEAAQQFRFGEATELTAHPNAPMSYLRQIARKSPTKMSDAGWSRLRDVRHASDEVAMVLAVSDPDSFHRNEAYAQVEVMNFDNLDASQRGWLARNLHKLPGDTTRQSILAASLVEWAKMSSDLTERETLFRNLAGSSSEKVQQVGAKALSGAGLAMLDDPATGQDKKRGGLFSRR